MTGYSGHPLRGRAARIAFCSVVALCGLAGPALAQEGVTTGAGVPEWVKKLAIDPESSQAKKYAAQQKVRKEKEKELRKLRVKHFGDIKKTDIRQEGILKLREYTDPALFPVLVEVFEREDYDVRSAVLDIFADSATPEGDTTLTWIGIFDKSPEVRSAAIQRLNKRIKQEGGTPDGVRLVTFEGIRSGETAAMASAANLAVQLNMFEAIPWMIAGQVQFGGSGAGQGGGGGGGDGNRNGALAWILVGTQTAYVSDLTPVVGPNAVAFDPQLAVVTEGVILRVLDAAVVSYNLDLNNGLKRLASQGMDGKTVDFGWDVLAWQDWYAKEFKPYRAQKDAEAKALAAARPQAAAPATPPTKRPD
ncbi:MAG TPA: hypothetical protein VD997_00420 [Phycisphaerales bacterium]|nr:hypothetical protein [Phycisphaerales bacterium]